LYKRILLKISGEALAGQNTNQEPMLGINPDMLSKMTTEIKAIYDKGIEIAIVIGGGNFFRGATSLPTIERENADYMGMLATVMNAIALQNALKNAGIDARHVSALPVTVAAEPYVRDVCIRHLTEKRVVIFSGGTGNPYFTTDTAAVLRATEMGCNLLLKATKVDGVYCSDPKQNAQATHFKTITYRDILQKNLKVMDATAITLAHENNLPIAIFSIYEENNLEKVLSHDTLFTLIKD
jgi:uridylate kinase